jgi:hypothetical protein
MRAGLQVPMTRGEARSRVGAGPAVAQNRSELIGDAMSATVDAARQRQDRAASMRADRLLENRASSGRVRGTKASTPSWSTARLMSVKVRRLPGGVSRDDGVLEHRAL